AASSPAVSSPCAGAAAMANRFTRLRGPTSSPATIRSLTETSKSRFRSIPISSSSAPPAPQALRGSIPVLQEIGEPPQPAMSRRTNRTRTLAEDLCDARHVEANDNPQQHRLGLLLWQRTDQCHGGVGRDGLQHPLLGVVVARPVLELIEGGGHRRRRSPSPTAQVVERTVAGDRHHPAPKTVRVARKVADVAGNLGPGLRRDVLGVLAHKPSDITEDSGLKRTVDGAEREFVARASPVERPTEVGGLHGLPQPPPARPAGSPRPLPVHRPPIMLCQGMTATVPP